MGFFQESVTSSFIYKCGSHCSQAGSWEHFQQCLARFLSLRSSQSSWGMGRGWLASKQIKLSALNPLPTISQGGRWLGDSSPLHLRHSSGRLVFREEGRRQGSLPEIPQTLELVLNTMQIRPGTRIKSNSGDSCEVGEFTSISAHIPPSPRLHPRERGYSEEWLFRVTH